VNISFGKKRKRGTVFIIGRFTLTNTPMIPKVVQVIYKVNLFRHSQICTPQSNETINNTKSPPKMYRNAYMYPHFPPPWFPPRTHLNPHPSRAFCYFYKFLLGGGGGLGGLRRKREVHSRRSTACVARRGERGEGGKGAR